MAPDQTNLMQGTLHMMILKALALGELHGLGVSRRIEQITKGTFQVKPGSLFPALHCMEEEGWLESHWGESEKQSARQVLQADRRGTAAPGSGNQALGPHCAGDYADARSVVKRNLMAFARMKSLLRNLLHKQREERELDKEVRAHELLLADENIR